MKALDERDWVSWAEIVRGDLAPQQVPSVVVSEPAIESDAVDAALERSTCTNI